MDSSIDLAGIRSAVLWLAPAFGLPVYCYLISQTRRNALQHILWIVGITVCCMIPLTVPATNTAARWWLSLLTFAMTLKMAHGWASGARFGSVGEAQFFFLQPMTPPNPRPLVDAGKPRERALRGVLKLVCLFAMAVVNSAVPAIRANVFTAAYFCLWAVYFVVSGFVDVYSGLVMWFTQWDTSEFCNAPFLATGPRDFWSRRWNMLFRNVTHACIFTPLKNLGIPPLYGVALVFIVSCLVHEYMVLVSSQSHQWLGWMTAFFVVHALATVLNTYVARNKTWLQLINGIPNAVFIVLHMAWIALTAPLFFTPAMQCIPILEYTLF
jgi:hypothetical protein